MLGARLVTASIPLIIAACGPSMVTSAPITKASLSATRSTAGSAAVLGTMPLPISSANTELAELAAEFDDVDQRLIEGLALSAFV